MSQELLYTSAPKGLKPGSRGFCTVLSTQGMSAPLATAVENLSGYRPIYSACDERASRNPVVYSHVLMQAAGRQWHVLSRIADYGLDYSQRSNKLAHHVILDSPSEQLPGGPANLLAMPGFMRDAWDGEPKIVGPKPIVREPKPFHGNRESWKDFTGNAGSARLVADSFLNDPDRLVILLIEPEQQVLPLFAEVISLLPPEKRWDVTFSTYFTGLVAGTICNWRAMIKGSKEALDSMRFVNAMRIDLTLESLQPPPARTLVTEARDGRGALDICPPDPISATSTDRDRRVASEVGYRLVNSGPQKQPPKLSKTVGTNTQAMSPPKLKHAEGRPHYPSTTLSARLCANYRRGLVPITAILLCGVLLLAYLWLRAADNVSAVVTGDRPVVQQPLPAVSQKQQITHESSSSKKITEDITPLSNPSTNATDIPTATEPPQENNSEQRTAGSVSNDDADNQWPKQVVAHILPSKQNDTRHHAQILLHLKKGLLDKFPTLQLLKPECVQLNLEDPTQKEDTATVVISESKSELGEPNIGQFTIKHHGDDFAIAFSIIKGNLQPLKWCYIKIVDDPKSPKRSTRISFTDLPVKLEPQPTLTIFDKMPMTWNMPTAPLDEQSVETLPRLLLKEFVLSAGGHISTLPISTMQGEDNAWHASYTQIVNDLLKEIGIPSKRKMLFEIKVLPTRPGVLFVSSKGGDELYNELKGKIKALVTKNISLPGKVRIAGFNVLEEISSNEYGNRMKELNTKYDELNTDLSDDKIQWEAKNRKEAEWTIKNKKEMIDILDKRREVIAKLRAIRISSVHIAYEVFNSHDASEKVEVDVVKFRASVTGGSTASVGESQ